MADRETNVGNFLRTTLNGTMGATDLTATVESTSGFPAAPCILVLEPESQARREIILFDAAGTATTFVTSDIGNRYLAGSAAASGLSHPVGAVVLCAPLSQHIEDLNDRIDADAVASAATATSLTDHVAATTAHSATAEATASRLVVRDAAGRAKFAAPSVAGDAATKGYVDGVGSASADPSTIARRAADGTLSVATPSSAGHAATKGYVDSLPGTDPQHSTLARGGTSYASSGVVDWASATGPLASAADDRFTIGGAGVYLVVVTVGVTLGSDGSVLIRRSVNSGSSWTTLARVGHPGHAADRDVQVVAAVALNAGDYVRVEMSVLTSPFATGNHAATITRLGA